MCSILVSFVFSLAFKLSYDFINHSFQKHCQNNLDVMKMSICCYFLTNLKIFQEEHFNYIYTKEACTYSSGFENILKVEINLRANDMEFSSHK